MSDGTERSQPLSVRGLPNRPIPFYFDGIVDGSLSLDIFGRLVARPFVSPARSRCARTAVIGSNHPGPPLLHCPIAPLR